MSAQHQPPRHVESQSRGSVILARLFWFFIGPLALVLLAYLIFSGGDGWTTWYDAAFGGVVGLMLLARWFELQSGEGQDSYGNPANASHFPRYLRLAVPIALAVWLVANVLGNHVFNGPS